MSPELFHPVLSMLPHLRDLESQAIGIIWETMAAARTPVLLFSGGKDSTVLAELVRRAFHPGPPPIPLLHVDSTWEFPEVIAFRDEFARRHGFELRVHANEDGRRRGLNPLDHGVVYTNEMRTNALREALDQGGYDFILGGARRDEEVSRAKERIFSVRARGHVWEPRQQRPELWRLYNGQIDPGQSVRVYPLSNWTEQDLWLYILQTGMALAPLYFAAEREVVEYDGTLIAVDGARSLSQFDGLATRREKIRFRTLGCWPVTGAIASQADTPLAVLTETLSSRLSERMGRVSDAGTLEAQKRQGYF